MLEKIRVVFTIPELRRKILLTLLLLAIYRVGFQISLPIFNQEAIGARRDQGDNGMAALFDRAAMFAAADLRQATIFGLGIMPYISASIIFQLLGSVWKPIEDLKKEGETGRKKINEYTRYLTVALCFVQSWMYLAYDLQSNPANVAEDFKNAAGHLHFGWHLTCVWVMTCGTVFLMWLGEQIDEFGIGNGISLLIMAGILARMPRAGRDMFSSMQWRLVGDFRQQGLETLIVLIALFVLVVAAVVFITQGQRRIPTQSAKHVRGRRVYGGMRQYLPLRINQANVMPIIFASSLLMLPAMLFGFLHNVTSGAVGEFFQSLASSFNRGSSFLYNVLYVGLIYFFCYFWTAITFNPKEMSENLKDHGTFIPGYRPGKRTGEYLEKVMVRITYVGAGFLACIALAPTLVTWALGVPPTIANFYGGTGLLIAVSVAFDLVQKIDSHLVMRNYRGLLED